MALWAAKVDRTVREPAGTDEGFAQEAIERYRHATFERMSTLEIVCEEVLDTAHPRVYFERARLELNRRGIDDEDYQELRHFAWLTAGWLNYEKMLWEWCHLDGRDIYRAIEWQFSDGWIPRVDYEERRRFADRYASTAERSPVLEPPVGQELLAERSPPVQRCRENDLTEPRFLGRTEIVDQTILRVYAGEKEDFGSVSVSRCFVELSGGTLFEIVSNDDDERVHLPRFDALPNRCSSPHAINNDCVGRTVVEVVSSDQWPSIGLQLSGGMLLYCSDDASPNRVGPATSMLGDFYHASDIRPLGQ